MSIKAIVQQSIGISIALSVLMIVAGILAIGLPGLSGIAVNVLVAWLLLFSGVGHAVFAWHVRGAGAMIWELLVGVLYFIVGVDLLMHPLAGLVTLTLLLSIYLAGKAVIELILGVSIRPVPGSGWLIFDAVISLILAVMIWRHLPVASEWVIGTLVGFAMLFSGLSRLLLSLAARKAVQAV